MTEMAIPVEYQGREQSYLKHRFLKDYLDAWGHKLGKTKRKLWYVDCFAGPWGSKSPDLTDTSIAIGLKALLEAAASWRSMGIDVPVGAIFIERDDEAFELLAARVEEAKRAGVDAHAFHGEFAQSVAKVQTLLGTDPAFIFVDPKGWLGAEMKHFEPLVRPKYRDVLVNVMFNFINIAQGSKQQIFHDQLDAFFGLSEDEKRSKLGEEELLALYREKLRKNCEVPFTADIAIPRGDVDRTWFRLVVGGHDPAALEVFRAAEKKLAGVAAEVREEAKRVRRGKTKHGKKQPELALPPAGDDALFDVVRKRDVERIEPMVLHALQHGSCAFKDLWPPILAELHVTKTDVGQTVAALRTAGVVDIIGLAERERIPKDGHIIRRSGS